VNRRDFITLLGAAATPEFCARLGHAQQSGRPARIGILANSLSTPLMGAGYREFSAELRQLGFVEGRNLVIASVEREPDSGGNAKLFADAAELARSNVDLFVTFGPELYLQAAVAASRTVPTVVLAFNFDPILRGYAASLARPGGNVTGVTFRQPELASKQIELLREAFPDRTRLAVLYDAQTADQFQAAELAAKTMKLQLRALKLENPPYDFAAAIRSVMQDRAEMALVLSSSRFGARRDEIAALAAAQRLPTMFTFKTYVEVGGLMAYGVDYMPSFRRVAMYVAKILNGAKPADLPVEQVTSFDLAVNLKTAKAIGVELPTSILLRANTVIE
jgi:putative ABC transport system substrate-binding protein